MAARTRDMTRGNPTKLILSFCLPIIAGNLFQQFYSLVDTLVIGRVEGVTALAAVSAAVSGSTSAWLLPPRRFTRQEMPESTSVITACDPVENAD